MQAGDVGRLVEEGGAALPLDLQLLELERHTREGMVLVEVSDGGFKWRLLLSRSLSSFVESGVVQRGMIVRLIRLASRPLDGYSVVQKLKRLTKAQSMIGHPTLYLPDPSRVSTAPPLPRELDPSVPPVLPSAAPRSTTPTTLTPSSASAPAPAEATAPAPSPPAASTPAAAFTPPAATSTRAAEPASASASASPPSSLPAASSPPPSLPVSSEASPNKPILPATLAPPPEPASFPPALLKGLAPEPPSTAPHLIPVSPPSPVGAESRAAKDATFSEVPELQPVADLTSTRSGEPTGSARRTGQAPVILSEYFKPSTSPSVLVVEGTGTVSIRPSAGSPTPPSQPPAQPPPPPQPWSWFGTRMPAVDSVEPRPAVGRKPTVSSSEADDSLFSILQCVGLRFGHASEEESDDDESDASSEESVAPPRGNQEDDNAICDEGSGLWW